MTAADARGRFLWVVGLRYLPIGLLAPVLVLVMQERGLTLTQVGLVASVHSATVLLLELPSGALADALGRRPVLALAAAIRVGMLALFLTAASVEAFVVAYAVEGLFRALDSGSLEAWFVDAVHAAEPDGGAAARVQGGLAAGGVVIGLSMAGGSLLAGWAPLLLRRVDLPWSPASVPVALALLCAVLHTAAVLVLVTEAHSGRGFPALRAGVAAVPATVRTTLRLAQRTRALVALLLIELAWGLGIVGVETLWQPRFADLLGGNDDVLVFGAASAGAWVAAAAGFGATPALVRALRGRAWLAGVVARGFQGLAVLAMVASGGIVPAVATYALVYVANGVNSPIFMGLLHRNVDRAHRATMLSAVSLTASIGGFAGGATLGAVADAAGIPAAWTVSAALLGASGPLYLATRAGVTRPGVPAGRPDSG